jgi:hypothetical protein
VFALAARESASTTRVWDRDDQPCSVKAQSENPDVASGWLEGHARC